MNNSIFDTSISKIRNDDPLREEKKDAFGSVRLKLHDLRMTEKGGYSTLISKTVVRNKFLEKCLPVLINNNIDDVKEVLWTRGKHYDYDNFENDWHERIINSSEKKEVAEISKAVGGVLKNKEGRLRTNLKRMYSEVYPTIWKDLNEFKKSSHSDVELLKKLKLGLTEFDKVAAKISLGGAEWNKKLVISIFRDELLARITDQEKLIGEKGIDILKSEVGSEDRKTEGNRNSKVESIRHELEYAHFEVASASYYGNIVNINRINVNYRGHLSLYDWEKSVKSSINDLNDNLLETGSKKADLLRELEETIKSKKASLEKRLLEQHRSELSAGDNDSISETSNSESNDDGVSLSSSDRETSSDDYSVSSIFSEYEDEEEEETSAWLTDNSSVSSEDNNSDKSIGGTWEKDNSESSDTLEDYNRLKDEGIQKITEFLNKGPFVITEADLEPENRNWREKLSAIPADKFSEGEAFRIAHEVMRDIKEKRAAKKQSVDLDNIIENVSDLFEDKSADNQEKVIKNLRTLNKSLGDEANEKKAQRAKKKMLEKDPEFYFDSFIDFIKEEEAKLEEEMKKEEEAEASLELEYDEEEQQFLAGEITDEQKKAEIAERLEIKINVKQKSWSLRKWLKAQLRWLNFKARTSRKKNKVGIENKAKQIEQELNNTKNSSNKYTRRAYQNNKQQAEELLSKLNTISQDSTTENDKGGLLRKEVIIPVTLVGVALLVVIGLVVVRKRKLTKKNK